MKYLGIDFGTKRIGVAVSDAAGTIAFPRATFQNDGALWEALSDVIKKERVEAVVVGDTRTFSGEANEVTRAMERFTARLNETASLPIFFAREAGSSVAVSGSGADAHDDASAAAFILQRYLDMHPKRVPREI